MFKRRFGQNNQCSGGHHCSQLLEMEDGDIAAVGLLITEEATKAMLPGAGVGPKEGVVKIPRHVFMAAKPEILALV